LKEDHKRLKREYLEGAREAGVFQIRNTANEKVLVVSALDLPGLMNRHRFELNAGGHRNRRLQADWDEFGADKFAFEVLDQLVPRDGTDARAELTFLEDLWLERLEPYGERGYNEPKAGAEEKLRRIAARRLKSE
jgi:hypothetical protein